MTGLVNGGRKLKLTVRPKFWSLWRIEIRLSLGSGRVFFIAHIKLVAIFGRLVRLVMKTTADTSISKIRRRNLLIESVELDWLGWLGVSFTVRAEENVIGSLLGGLREWLWFPLETV